MSQWRTQIHVAWGVSKPSNTPDLSWKGKVILENIQRKMKSHLQEIHAFSFPVRAQSGSQENCWQRYQKNGSFSSHVGKCKNGKVIAKMGDLLHCVPLWCLKRYTSQENEKRMGKTSAKKKKKYLIKEYYPKPIKRTLKTQGSENDPSDRKMNKRSKQRPHQEPEMANKHITLPPGKYRLQL